MSIADKITSITGHLEDDYTALETLGVSVENRNIENIKDMANQIYNKFPKTEYQEGSNITLENTLKGKLDFDKLEGDTLQNGEPTPTTPIPIEVVTGEQEVTVRGTQLIHQPTSNSFDETNGVTFEWNKDGTYYIHGTATANIQKMITIDDGIIRTATSTYASTLQAGTYTISVENISGTPFNIRLRSGTTNIATASTSGASATLTEVTSNISIYIYISSGTSVDYKFKIQLEKGSIKHDWQPYITPITKQLSLGDLEFAKTGDYKDYIWKNLTNGKWYKHSEVGKYTFTGTEYCTYASNRFQFLNLVPNTETNGRQQIYCNRLPYLSTGSADYGMFSYYATVTGKAVYVYDKDYTDTDAFKSYLANNNTYFYYILNTATDTEITDTTLISQLEDIYNLMSNNGTTIIEVSGNLPMILKVRALKG